MTTNQAANSEWVAIQINPKAGSGSRRRELDRLVNSLKESGLRPVVFKNRERLMGTLSSPELRDRLRCIVAVGGDGTVGDAINRYPGVRLTILPWGTENLLAHYLKIPTCGERIGQIIAAGNVRQIDLAEVNGRRFSLMASIGFDADVVHRMDAIRSGHVFRASYIKPIWDSLRNYGYPELRLRLDDDQTVYPAKLVMIVNLNAYALGIQPAQSARDNDGILDVRLFEQGSAFQMLRYFYNVQRGTHEKLHDVLRLQAKRIRVESDVPVAVQVDGDPAGMTPVEIRVLPGAGEFLVPAEAANVAD